MLRRRHKKLCRLRNIAIHDYQESVTTGQRHTHTHTLTERSLCTAMLHRQPKMLSLSGTLLCWRHRKNCIGIIEVVERNTYPLRLPLSSCLGRRMSYAPGNKSESLSSVADCGRFFTNNVDDISVINILR